MKKLKRELQGVINANRISAITYWVLLLIMLISGVEESDIYFWIGMAMIAIPVAINTITWRKLIFFKEDFFDALVVEDHE